MKDYTPRIFDEILEDYFGGLPAICIDGAKGVGKTSTASLQCSTVFKLEDSATRSLIAASPELIASADKPVLIDEWQRLPEVWDKVRNYVDEDSSPKQYILTGSAYPKDSTIHSGAGRIVHIRMRPFSLEERRLQAPSVRIKDLLKGVEKIESSSTEVKLQDYVYEITQSGFPAIHELTPKSARRQIAGYIDNIVEREFSDQGYKLRNPRALRNWLRSYAAATATTAAYKAILDGATPGESDKPSKDTTFIYRNILDQIWMIDSVDPWLPLGSNYKYLGKTPKHYLVDPALSASLLDLTSERLLRGDDALNPGPQEKTILGRLFESLVAQSLQTYALANDASLRHFRSSDGAHEVDFIIEKAGHVIALEVKLASTPDRHVSRHLNWFEKEFCGYTVTKAVITTGLYAYTQQDGVHVIPAVLLGA